jgi:hypothetical protein
LCHKFHKIENHFFTGTEKKLSQLTKNTFYPKNMGWGSQIRDPEKTIADPGVKEAPDPVSATLSLKNANLEILTKTKMKGLTAFKYF